MKGDVEILYNKFLMIFYCLVCIDGVMKFIIIFPSVNGDDQKLSLGKEKVG